MDDHLLFIRSLSFSKTEKGDWAISRVASNRGTFAINEDQLLETDVVNRFCSYVVSVMKDSIEGFLSEEAQEGENEGKH